VAFFTGWLSMQDHADKLRGFQASLQSFGGALQLGPVVEAHDDEREGYRRAVAVLREHPDLTAIYVSTVNSLPVLRAAEQEGSLPRLTVVTTDLFPELVDRIRAGVITATLYQRPLSQGRLALQALYDFLLHGTRPPPRLHVVPHLVMRSNLDMFLERLPGELESGAATLDSHRVGAPRPAARPAARVPGTRTRRTAGRRQRT
jgi:LacI family transcriptional regulator